jgi:uncharacterized membrane protein YesL
MKDLFSINSGAYKAMTFIYRILVLNFLCCICIIPIISAGAAITALYYCIGKMVRNEEINEFKDYFKSFRENFKQGTIIWAIICLIFLIGYFNLNYSTNLGAIGNVLFVIQIPIMFQLSMIALLVFPILSRYEASISGLFKYSIILSNKYLIRMIICLILLFGIAYASIKFLPLMVFGSFGLMGYCSYGLIYPILEKYNIKDNIKDWTSDPNE